MFLNCKKELFPNLLNHQDPNDTLIKRKYSRKIKITYLFYFFFQNKYKEFKNIKWERQFVYLV